MADQFLAKGAGQVAAAKGSGNLAASRAGTGVGAFLAEGIGKVVQKRNREFNRLMEAELAAAGDLSEEEYQDLFKRLQKKRGGYVYLNKRGKVQAQKELIEEGNAIKNDPTPDIIEDVVENGQESGQQEVILTNTNKKIVDGKTVYEIDERTKTALETNPDEVMYFKDEEGNDVPYLLDYGMAWNNEDPAGNPLDMPRFTTSADEKVKISMHGHIYPNTPEGQAIYVAHAESDWQQLGGQALDFTNEETLKETWYKHPSKEDYEKGNIKIFESHAQSTDKPGDLVDMNELELKGLLNQFNMDQDSQKKFATVVTSVTNDATAFTGGDTNKAFNRDAVKMNITNNIINSKDVNLRSLAKHNIWGSTSWETDMQEALQQGTYGDLGITNDDFKDPTPNDNKITAQDAQAITQNIMKNEALLKETLADYYTGIAENNYNTIAKNNKNQGGNNQDDEDEFN